MDVWTVVAGTVLVSALVALAWIDLRTGLLPDLLTLPLLWAGLLVNIQGVFAPLDQAVIGAVAGYSVLWLANQVYRWRAGSDGMGYGDFKMAGAIGAWIGVASLYWVVIAACAAALLVMGVLRLTGKVAAGHPMAFGPFLALAAIGVVGGSV